MPITSPRKTPPLVHKMPAAAGSVDISLELGETTPLGSLNYSGAEYNEGEYLTFEYNGAAGSVVVTPAPAIAAAATVAPTVTLTGPALVIPAPAIAVAATVAPTVVIA